MDDDKVDFQTEPSEDNAHLVAGLFALLLKGHSMYLQRGERTRASLSERFGRLLGKFENVSRSAEASDRAQAAGDYARLTELMLGYAAAVESDRRHQEDAADDFNLLAVMQLMGREIRHSMVLAWLLDHDFRRLGTHAQGRLGMTLFLREVGLPSVYVQERYWVRREVAGDNSIVDVEIACRGKFLIHIENKIWSDEGTDQTNREWFDLRRRAVALGLNPDAEGTAIHALYLTPRGAKPLNPNFRSVSWGQIVHVLEMFAEQAKPADVKLFAAHYARALRRFIVMQDSTVEEDYGEAATE